jgi:hypothetical protein
VSRSVTNIVGSRFGRLAVLNLDEVRTASGGARWLCLCDCGTTIIVDATNLKSGNTTSCGCFRRERMASLGRASALAEHVGYVAAHSRVKRLHGPAKHHLCVDCLRPASSWSYDHEDPQQHVDPRGRAYSTNPAHYWPRCRTCHIAYDSAAIPAAVN